MRWHIRNAVAVMAPVVVGCVALTASLGLAQQTASPATTIAADPKAPPRLTFDLSIGLTHDDNKSLSVTDPNPVTALDTRFGLTFNTAARGQTLVFSVSALARGEAGQTEVGQAGLKLRDPSAKLSYTRDTANSRLSVTGQYQEAPVDLFDPLTLADGSVSSTDFRATTGTITTRTAGFTFKTGVTGPLGFDLAGNYTGHGYSDHSDPNVYDNTSNDLKAGVHLRFGGEDEVSLTADRTAQDYQNAAKTTRRGQDITLSYARDLRPALKMQVSLGQGDDTTKENGVVTNHSSGLTGSLGVTQTLGNGTAGITLGTSRDSLGARQSLSFSRAMALPTGKLEIVAGVSARSGGTPQAEGSLAYSRTLPVDSFGVQLSRHVTLDGNDADVANTALGVTYQHKITPVSNFGLSLNVQATGKGGSAAVDRATRNTLSATYSHDLTADWQVTAGYEHRTLDQSTSGTADSNSVFLTFSRKFTLLP